MTHASTFIPTHLSLALQVTTLDSPILPLCFLLFIFIISTPQKNSVFKQTDSCDVLITSVIPEPTQAYESIPWNWGWNLQLHQASQVIVMHAQV